MNAADRRLLSCLLCLAVTGVLTALNPTVIGLAILAIQIAVIDLAFFALPASRTSAGDGS